MVEKCCRFYINLGEPSAPKVMSLLSNWKMSFVYIMSISGDIIFNRISRICDFKFVISRPSCQNNIYKTSLLSFSRTNSYEVISEFKGNKQTYRYSAKP